MASQPALEQYQRQRQRALSAVLLARREWATMGEDFDAGWARVGPRLALLVASAQLGAAEDGARYVGTALAAADQAVSPLALVKPRAFAGISSGGQSLDGLLYGSVVHARQADVSWLAERLDVGGRHLDALVQGQVADAGRDASSAAVTARPRVSWVRVVNPPCCQRCAVLAGRVYRYSQSFQRHPRCDCTMLPQTVANPDAVGIRIGAEDVKDLTRKQRAAIDDGADFNKTINDYQRKRGDYLPPTRVDRITAQAANRTAAVDALTRAGYLAA